MKLSMIVAVAQNGVIGRNNELPWHLPEDLKYFKRVTMGKPIIMGRKTFESIGRALPGRLNIVVSRGTPILPDGVKLASSVAEAKSIAHAAGASEAMIIGGAQLYREAAHLADCLYWTEVKAEVEGDAYFDAVNLTDWIEVERVVHAACDRNQYAYDFVVYHRC